MIEYWDNTDYTQPFGKKLRNEFKFEFKIDSDLYELNTLKIEPLNIEISYIFIFEWTYYIRFQ